ncbi:hypothetical protein PG987_007376 [Apiospora arundinis]
MPFLWRLVFPLFFLAAIALVWAPFILSGGLDTINDAIAQGRYPGGEKGVTSFTGVPAIDDALMSLVAFNLPVVNADFLVGRVFMAQFLANVSVMSFILLVEAQRGSKQAHVPWSAKAGKVLAPLESSIAALPSHIIGFIVPALMMFDPLRQGPYAKSLWTLAFSLFPITVTVSYQVLSLVARLLGKTQAPRTVPHSEVGRTSLHVGYALTGTLAATAHVSTVALTITHPDSLLHGLLSLGYSSPLIQEKILTFLKFDYLITFGALLAFGLGELRTLHYGGSLKLAILLILGVLMLGPGGTIAIVWSIREDGLRKMKSKST